VPEIPDATRSSSSDFLSNLLVLLLRLVNVGLSDSGLLTHLSEATAGSLNGIGHSKAYEDLATYSWVSSLWRIGIETRFDHGLGWP